MKKNIIIVTLICFFLISTTFISVESRTGKIDSGSILFDEDNSDLIMGFLMKLGHITSLSTCIIIGDEIVWSEGYGLSNIEENRQTTENTIYMICSISKTITGAALMQLYDQGLFALDDDVNLYLPFSLRNPFFPDVPITFRMLLSHSSSLNNDPASFYLLNNSQDPPFPWYPYPWIEEYLAPGGKYYVSGIWNENNPPGEPVMYSNANFVVVSYLVELLSGEKFIDYCQSHIFDPLEMHNASFSLSSFDLDDIAVPYHYFLGDYHHITDLDFGMSPPTDIYYHMVHYPVGGLYTSVMDLSHFLIAHMNGGVYKDVRILESETVDEMHTIQPPGLGYGLAWYYSRTYYGKIFSGHEGDIPGYHTMMFLEYPENSIGVIYFINGDRYTTIGAITSRLIQNFLFYKANKISDNMSVEIDENTINNNIINVIFPVEKPFLLRI